jgi:DUF4097 and DUF4098 domain-containing protein YvlB
MRRTMICGLCAAAVILFVHSAKAKTFHSISMSVGSSSTSMRSSGRVTSCDDIDVSYDRWRHVARSEQTLTIPGGTAVIAHLHGSNGVTVYHGSSANYTVHACKSAAANGDRNGDEQLAAISVTAHNGEISVNGPNESDERWNVYLIIEAPAEVSMDLSAENGPVELRDVSGKIKAHAENGPVGLDHCAGDIEGYARNGPVSFRGSGGNLKLHTDNGPLSIRLEGRQWAQGSLEGRTQNGPVSVSLEQGYTSGVVVESNGNSPFQCRADACGQAQRTWDDQVRRVEIGSKPVMVRLSTENGPVSVQSGRDREDQ